ncbi:NADH:flavin oxidoreductase/NADH oxidase [Marinobacterium mangrovicola]|uniref:2,4-dienoyl-CoA reductase-like NADH-dependent reductase (Old Yellow Enzyme family) n=1 Tax=Marinobacterium mangrovicola TaxID=1476959 RepID=A0A4R1GLH2_9GAMM|nr:NADH:flavin oxidoreductase/NADH oxidase [Marinobacterium mangrovicola]TCK09324.1 2,4-dienoyl-CoA reductase-like NADH-dependent reductase (Old Yellow Enzyme family) [Marinobacterium mangrovicola]
MSDQPASTLLQPFTLRGLTLKNRMVISPMCQHAAIDGQVQDWHLVHYGKFILGGAALVWTESTAIASDSRVGIADLGIWSDDHIEGLRKLADFAHNNGALMGVQLAHAGRKAFSAPLWEGGHALSPEEINQYDIKWRRVGPSAIAASSEWSTPDTLSVDEMSEIRQQFVDAALRADAAGMDAIELHYGHGYLIASFLSPHANHRQDEYGGTLENRMRYALEIAQATRAAWPSDKPLFVRLSCIDGVEGGWDLNDSVILARELKAIGIDVIDCSSGGLAEEVKRSNVPRGIGFQVPFAAEIREQAAIATQAVGLIVSAEHANDIISTGQADLVAVGRAALRNPYWPAEAYRTLSDTDEFDAWPERHGAWLDKRQPLLRRFVGDKAN